MQLLHRIAAALLGLAILPASIAGVEKVSSSTRPGLFFAWLSPDTGSVLAYSGTHADLQALARHCNSGRDVFSLQGGTKYKCKFEVFKLPSGVENWDGAYATVQGLSPKPGAEQFGLFSTFPPRTTKWTVRKVTPQELGAINSLVRSDARLSGPIRRQLKLSSASVVGRSGGSSFTVVVPGAVVRNEEAYYYAQRHHIFLQRDGMYSYLGEVPGKPFIYVDIDRNDLPGLVVYEDCDGLCISLWGLTNGLQEIGTFGGH